MPTTAELDRKIDDLERKEEAERDELTDKVISLVDSVSQVSLKVVALDVKFDALDDKVDAAVAFLRTVVMFLLVINGLLVFGVLAIVGVGFVYDDGTRTIGIGHRVQTPASVAPEDPAAAAPAPPVPDDDAASDAPRETAVTP